MARTRTWEISDEFWKLVEPLIPTSLRTADKTYKRRPGAGRKPKYSNRTYFAAMVYILRTGTIWNALPREKFGGLGSSALHHKFQQWTRAGLFRELWRKGLAEYDEIGGHRVALAGGRRHEHRSALGASIRWPQSDGSGKKTARSAVCWWTNVASPCHSS